MSKSLEDIHPGKLTCRRYFAASGFPLMHESMRVVFCSSFMVSSSAPACTSMCMVSTCPSDAATCSGVAPSHSDNRWLAE